MVKRLVAESGDAGCDGQCLSAHVFVGRLVLVPQTYVRTWQVAVVFLFSASLV